MEIELIGMAVGWYRPEKAYRRVVRPDRVAMHRRHAAPPSTRVRFTSSRAVQCQEDGSNGDRHRSCIAYVQELISLMLIQKKTISLMSNII